MNNPENPNQTRRLGYQKKTAQAKAYLKRHTVTAWYVLPQIPITSYLVGIHLLNPIPAYSTLETKTVSIVSTRNQSPHMQLATSDGQLHSGQFPVTTGFSPSPFHGISANELKSLENCSGSAALLALKGSIDRRLNVWEISCGTVHMSYDHIAKHAQISRKTAKSTFQIYLLITGFITLFFYSLEEAAHSRKKNPTSHYKK